MDLKTRFSEIYVENSLGQGNIFLVDLLSCTNFDMNRHLKLADILGFGFFFSFIDFFLPSPSPIFICSQLSDFTGPLIFDPPNSSNFVDAGVTGNVGVIYGNNAPVNTNFQVCARPGSSSRSEALSQEKDLIE